MAALGCAKPAPPDHLVLITIDTLRADHLGYQGYVRDTSPNLDELAGDSAAFLAASVQIPKTGPSMASLMTGRYPNGNSVLRNGHRLPMTELTLAEVLSAQGFSTAAFTTNPNLTEQNGMAQGFDEFTFQKGKIAGALTDAAIERLGQGFEGRFFLWLHYLDPHGHYVPPPPFNEQYVDDEHYDPTRRVELEYEPMKGFNKNYVLGAVPIYIQGPYRRNPRRTEHAYYVAQYDGEIRYLDQEIGRFLRFLEDENLLESTVLALTADHGESMGEHNYYFEHGWFLYEHQVNVPLLIRNPAWRWRGRVKQPVRLVDVAPTLVGALQLNVPRSFAGRNLAPLMRGERVRPAPVYYQTPREYPHFFRGMRLENWKYIVDAEGVEQLFDLSSDPQELNDLAAGAEDKLAVFRSRITAGPWVETREGGPEVISEDELSDEIREDLRALGYLD